jgi:predicted MFS family arabinose efflux permease
MYLGFALGSLIGGLVVATLSPRDLGWIGGTFAAIALALTLLFARVSRLTGRQIPG